jgi:hypothetical protein
MSLAIVSVLLDSISPCLPHIQPSAICYAEFAVCEELLIRTPRRAATSEVFERQYRGRIANTVLADVRLFGFSFVLYDSPMCLSRAILSMLLFK